MWQRWKGINKSVHMLGTGTGEVRNKQEKCKVGSDYRGPWTAGLGVWSSRGNGRILSKGFNFIH